MKIHMTSARVLPQRLPAAKNTPQSTPDSLGPSLETFRRKNPSLVRIGATATGATAGGIAGHFLAGPTGSAIGATVGAMIGNEISRSTVGRTSRAHVSELDHQLFPVAERLNTVVALAGAIGIVATATLITLGAH